MYMILIRLVKFYLYFFSKGKISIVVVEKVRVEKHTLENISDASSLLSDNYSKTCVLVRPSITTHPPSIQIWLQIAHKTLKYMSKEL